MPLRFGEFELDQERRQLLRSGRPVSLEPKAYELLSLLVERRPRALSRAQIRDGVWPGTIVSGSTLGVVVNGIRQALGDDARQPRFVRTVHGFGYAFCGEVRDTADERGETSGASTLDEPSNPYPGLSAFTERDAARFFGREAEVAALWEKIQRRRLLAVIGPSGVGKTSFLRAGVMAKRPAGWAAAYATPGSNPPLMLARALLPGLGGDTETIGELLEGVQELGSGGGPARAASAVRRWRDRTDQALLVVDQVEELFTLNPPDAQGRFAQLLERLTAESDLHLVLCLRDDFLFRCAEHESLRPVFHDITPLTPPSPPALRRAVVEPAADQGVGFEAEGLVQEMVETVAGERGALPLLAFAASRLWEERHRDRKLLTREAYERIGGVVGALARHAEATLAALGPEWEGAVREILRNLVTPEGTRATRDREELLSVFTEEREGAEAVLDALVDARLLTVYAASEAAPAGKGSTSPRDPRTVGSAGNGAVPVGERERVEVVHESLLTHWPRLVRWQTQDADGALLREQLRQAARHWEDRGGRDDLLWTGASYLEYCAWRSRYPGRLSTVEEAFARAMKALANRRRRRRRVAAATALAAALVVAVSTSVLWRRSVAARGRAEAEARRAEASRLLALGQKEADGFPTGAFAYAVKSLETADGEEARLFALRMLQRAPLLFRVPGNEQDGLEALTLAFNPDGSWLAIGGYRKVKVLHRDGRAPLVLGDYPSGGFQAVLPVFSPRGDLLVAVHAREIRAYSIPDGREIWRGPPLEGTFSYPLASRHRLYTVTAEPQGQRATLWSVHELDATTGTTRRLGVAEGPGTIDANDRWYAYQVGREVRLRDVDHWASRRVLGRSKGDVIRIVWSPDGRTLGATDAGGELRLWSADATGLRPVCVFSSKATDLLGLDGVAQNVAVGTSEGQHHAIRMWDLTAPRDTEPRLLKRNDLAFLNDLEIEPHGRWLATSHANESALWPIAQQAPRMLAGHQSGVESLAFTPDGRSLLSASGDGTLRAWPLSNATAEGRVLLRTELAFPGLALDPAGRLAAVSGANGRIVIVPLDGGVARELTGFSQCQILAVAFSPSGRRVAAAPFIGPASEKVVRVWDLDSGVASVFGPVPGVAEGFGGAQRLSFLNEDRLLVGRVGSRMDPLGDVTLSLVDGRFDVRRWSQDVGWGSPPKALALSPDGSFALGLRRMHPELSGAPEGQEAVWYGLTGSRFTPLPSHGSGVFAVALDPSGRIVATGSTDGTVRIGTISGEEPHVLLGHEGLVRAVAFSPDGKWLASAGEDRLIRLWPVPDVSKRPLHTLPLQELLARLHTCTNVLVEVDPKGPGHYRYTRGPFPGWATVPDCGGM